MPLKNILSIRLKRATIIPWGTNNITRIKIAPNITNAYSLPPTDNFWENKKYRTEKIITAGIDYNDAGWAEEFQNEDGEFLLLLEKSKDADFLIPVGGPNGMIQIYDGKIEESNDERRTFFEDILTTEPLKIVETKVVNDIDSQNDNSNLLLYVITSVLVGLAVLILLYRYKRNKITNDKL